jgi:hypothetical protein
MSRLKHKNLEIADQSELTALIKNNGWLPGSDHSSDSRLSIEDAITSAELGPWVKHSIVEIMMEPMEPMLNLTPLLDTIPAPDGITEFRLPALSAFTVHKVTELEGYREERVTTGGGMATAAIDKWGVMISLTQEAIKASNWNLLGYLAREAGRAFARRKETEIAKHITNISVPAFDNLNPEQSALGITTGRDITLKTNGTLTIDDLFNAYHLLIQRGFTPDTLICHPLTYLMFVRDPVLRAFAMQSGSGNLFGNYTGSAANVSGVPDAVKGVLSKGYSRGQLGTGADGSSASLKDFNVNAITAAPQLPIGLPFGLRIVTSRFMPYDPATKLTDIVLCDSKSLGALIVGSGIVADEWEDKYFETFKMKWSEKWGIFMYNEGQGLVTLKNIFCDQNFYAPEIARPVYDPTSGFLPAGDAINGSSNFPTNS